MLDKYRETYFKKKYFLGKKRRLIEYCTDEWFSLTFFLIIFVLNSTLDK